MPWCPSPIPRPAEPPVRVTVDGEVFDVTTQPDHPGHYHYAWISGPNPGYGFSSASSDGRPSSMVDHEEAIWKALQEGGVLYVCGDAAGMAAGVRASLARVISEKGGLSAADAEGYLDTLAAEKRYQLDVWAS